MTGGVVADRETTASERPAARGRTRPRIDPRVGWGALGVVTFLAAWQWAGSYTNPIFFSTPLRVAQAAPTVLDQGHLFSLYVGTMTIFIVGTALAMVIGIGVGIVTGLSRRVRYFVEPLIVSAYSTPALVLIPIFILWFGIGNEAKIALILFAGTFPPLVNTQLGIDQMGPQMNELGRSFGANRREMLLKIVLPSIVPFSMTGVRLAVPRALVAVIAAEMLVTAQGVGGLIEVYGQQFQTTFYFVPVILIVVTGIVINELVKALEKALTPWRQ